MKAMTKSAGLAALVLTAGLLTGCGNSTDAYCDELQGTIDEFGTLTGGNDLDQLEDALDAIERLADEAPDEIDDEWDRLVEVLDEVRDSFDEAGIEFSDLGGIQDGQLPEGVSQEDLAELGQSLQSLSGEEVQQAATAINEHALEECGIDLENSGTQE